MPNYRVKQLISLGVATETTEGTSATFTSAAFVNDFSADLMSVDINKIKVNLGGSTGVSYLENGATKGSVTITGPVSSSKELPFVYSAGGIVSGSSIYVGGRPITSAGANRGRIGSTSLTIGQYDHSEFYCLYGAKPDSFKITGKAGEIVSFESSLVGAYDRYATTATYIQRPTFSTSANNLVKGSTLLIDGVAMSFTNVEIDFGLTTSIPKVGNTNSGYSIPEVTNLEPKVKVELLTLDPATYNFWNKFSGTTASTFSWSFGSGTGNSYTLTGSVKFEKLSHGDTDGIHNTTLEGYFIYDTVKALSITIV